MVVAQHTEFSSCLNSVKKYLSDSNLTCSSEGTEYKGKDENTQLGTRILELVNNSKLSWSVYEKANFLQWLEYVYLYRNNKQNSTVLQQTLQEINVNLVNKSFLVNNRCSVADVVLYSILYDSVVKMTFQEKEQYLHLSRWFNTVQRDTLIRQSRPLVNFSRTLLYS